MVRRLKDAIIAGVDTANTLSDYPYIPTTVSSLVLKLLESVYIITTSKNIDTIVGRYNFLLQPIILLSAYSFEERYLSDMQHGLDKYKQLYYDRIPTDEQIFLIKNPSLKNLQSLYLPNIIKCIENFYNDLMIIVSKLKTKKAKYNCLNKAFPTIK